ncbi:xanthine dehydrogenase family protein molybdopterin-binding subunit [Acidianus manzaensis]|uniref:Aldehyde oxidase n=1 Tax=Acidianus manzaensis TaxID=282676 RepID=A0A1W6K2V8_9CREN|nr:xanthine dehydrogenase family protein molybdopterin-binding subunit [Acidianus manzaensis]ARM76856.1 aldehyde oxidase [Acidianus manzaensis]
MIKEHERIITGHSTYIDDITPSNVAYLYVIRSRIARGIIKNISRPTKGLLSLTWDDVKAYIPARFFGGMERNSQIARMPVLAKDRVNFVGQPVLAVVAEDRYETEDIAEDVSIDYEELKPVVDVEDALNVEPIHPELKSNISVDQLLEGGDLRLKEKAEVVVRRKIKQSRVVSNPLEPKGFICWWEGDILNIYVSTQAPFGVRNDLREILGIPPEKIRVLSPPNVGGGFGNKSGGYAEYVLASLASLKLHRPIKWIETRSEILNNAQSLGRGEVSDMKLYATKQGEILGMEGTVIANIGAYDYGINYFASSFVARLSNGPYKVKFASIRAMSVFTNTPPMGFYRGAGRPEAALIHETLVEDLADELGMDPVEIRKKNLVDDSGYVTPLGLKFDPAGYHEVLNKAENYYRKMKEIHKDKGVSIIAFTEIVRASPGEGARAKIHGGKVYFYLGLGPHGQAYASSFKGVASQVLGIDEDKIEIITGSTDNVKEGIGSFGSRGGTVGSSAVIAAAEELLKKMNGKIDLSKEEEVEVFYKTDDIFAPGAHVAVVDVDKETGLFKVIEYYAVDDVGKTLNKEEVEGQIIGGALQGASQVMIESMKYDENGNPLFSSIADCGVLSATEAPRNIHVDTVEYPSGVLSHSRGVGEAGTTGALPAVFIALEKATKKKYSRLPVDPQIVLGI